MSGAALDNPLVRGYLRELEAAFARLQLAPSAPVLAVPVASLEYSEIMRWQADTGEPGTLIGGYFLAPGATGQPAFDISPELYAAERISLLWSGRASYVSPALVRQALRYWRPAAVVALTPKTSRVGQLLISLLGRPSFQVGLILAWRL